MTSLSNILNLCTMNNSITTWPHAPPHHLCEKGTYIVTCGTYQKHHFLSTPQKLSLVRNLLFKLALKYQWELQAWAIMSNHYHFVASSPETPDSLKNMLSELHTLSARELNRIDSTPERRIWYNYYDSRITYEKSWYARLKYVHQNPAHHGVTDNAENYEWCSAAWFARETNSAFLKTVNSFKIDQVNVYDEYNNLECGGPKGGNSRSTPLLKTEEPQSKSEHKRPPSKTLRLPSKSDVKPSHSKELQSKSGGKPPPFKELAKLCHLTGKAIADYEMIQEGDRLLIGISGGIDSMMLMHVLDRLQKRAPIKFNLFAVTIDEGFDGISHSPLSDYAKEQSWNLKIIETPIAKLIVKKRSGEQTMRTLLPFATRVYPRLCRRDRCE